MISLLAEEINDEEDHDESDSSDDETTIVLENINENEVSIDLPEDFYIDNVLKKNYFYKN